MNNNPPSLPPPKPTTSQFHIGLVNRIILIISLLLVVLVRLPLLDSAYGFGQFTGTILAMLLFPYLFGWLVWRLRKKRKGAGKLVFGLVLGLSLLGQLSLAGQEMNKRNAFNQVETERSKFKTIYSESEDYEEISEARQNTLSTAETCLNDMVANSAGIERTTYEILATHAGKFLPTSHSP